MLWVKEVRDVDAGPSPSRHANPCVETRDLFSFARYSLPNKERRAHYSFVDPRKDTEMLLGMFYTSSSTLSAHLRR